MKLKRVLYLVVVLLLLALTITACGGQDVEVTRVVTQTETVTEQVEVTRVVNESVETIVEVETEQFPEGTEISLLQWNHFVTSMIPGSMTLLRHGVNPLASI